MADANRDMMGSKADMISAKFDEVSRNAIWREHVHKEDARPRDHAPFQINPHNLNVLCPKPGQVDPTKLASGDGAVSAELAELRAKLERKRGAGGVTECESEVTGFFHQRALLAGRFKTNKRWFKGKSSCDITRYADAYATMNPQHQGPFSDKGSR